MPKTTPIYKKIYFYFFLFLAICFGFFQKKKRVQKGCKKSGYDKLYRVEEVKKFPS